MKRTLAVALLLADLRLAVGFQPPQSRSAASTAKCRPPKKDRSTSQTAADAITITFTSRSTSLQYANDPYSAANSASSRLPDTTDPLVLLGLDAMSANDASAIKAAYRALTKRHHPDAVLSKDSTDAEKRAANDNFARINEAYQSLLARQKSMGKGFGGEEFGAQTFVDLEVRVWNSGGSSARS